MRRSLWLLLIPALHLACTTNSQVERDAPNSMSLAALGQTRGRMEGDMMAEPSADRLIVRSASISLVVESQQEAISQIETRVGELNGRVNSSTVHGDSASLSVRVPSEELDAFLDELSTFGEETRRSVTGRDVTDAYSDTEAEIANLASLRDRLRALLARADKVEEVLKVERELTRVQTRLDSLMARKQRMTTNLELSAVSISLSERPPKRILGPLGLVYEGLKWLTIKLFVISP